MSKINVICEGNESQKLQKTLKVTGKTYLQSSRYVCNYTVIVGGAFACLLAVSLFEEMPNTLSSAVKRQIALGRPSYLLELKTLSVAGSLFEIGSHQVK